MENNKLFVRIQPSEYTQSEIYFDFVEESAQGHLIVIGSPDYCDFKSKSWNNIEEVINTVSYYLENLVDYESSVYYKRFSDVLDDYFPGWENGNKRSGTLIHKWKEAVRKYDENGFEDETACELLDLYTGKKWDYSRIHDFNNGDYATLYFPAIESKTERLKYIDAISAFYFNSGVEVEIHDNENEPSNADEISGYWYYIPIPDANIAEIKSYLSEITGIDSENIFLYIPTHTSAHWIYKIDRNI